VDSSNNTEAVRIVKIVSIAIVVVVQILCLTWMTRDYLFTKEGYTREMLPGDSFSQWVKPSIE